MKTCPIQNFKYNNLTFKSSASINAGINNRYEPKENKGSNNKIPEWARKSALFGLIALSIANDPKTIEYFKPDEIKQNEKVQKEYFNDVSKLGMTPMAYHLNRLADVDKVIIKSKYHDNYYLELPFDNGKKIDFDINISNQNDNILYGYFKSDGGKSLKFKAIFDEDNSEEFKISIRNKDNTQYIFGRKPTGELYRVEGNKKIILNKKNVQDYKDKLKKIEELDNWEFFTNKNDLWRKLNLILLILLTFNEYRHDVEKREEHKNKK